MTTPKEQAVMFWVSILRTDSELMKKKFQEELTKLIPDKDNWTISVDYQPDYILREALTKAGFNDPFSMFHFPWKVFTDCHNGKLIACSADLNTGVYEQIPSHRD